jgi:hypothetical protein
VVNVPLRRVLPYGVLVVHNGAAPPPADTDPINGFEYDGSTQWKFVRWEAVVSAFRRPLAVAGGATILVVRTDRGRPRCVCDEC